MAKKTIEQIDVTGRRVLMRVDYNVPGAITDDRRIRASLPSVRSVLERGGRLVLMSHLGRPEGTGYQPELTLEPAAERLTELLGDACRGPVRFPSHDCVDGSATAAVNMLADGEALMLENLRFHKAEKKGDADFAAQLASYADVYCQRRLRHLPPRPTRRWSPSRGHAGQAPRLGNLVETRRSSTSPTRSPDPRRPFVVMLGGAKVSDKLPAIEHLLPKADAILIGGAMAYTFLKALGHEVGEPRRGRPHRRRQERIIDAAATERRAAPADRPHLLHDDSRRRPRATSRPSSATSPGLHGPRHRPGHPGPLRPVDPSARQTVVWNGPMGVFEWAPFRVGTKQVAEAIAEATEKGAVSIVGGGRLRGRRREVRRRRQAHPRLHRGRREPRDARGQAVRGGRPARRRLSGASGGRWRCGARRSSRWACSPCVRRGSGSWTSC
jgi:phosphoglycerate kinase